ncbi:MAG: InlB B-repeat-containing protein, partial [Candidatus Hermodarchaeia archaeon]
MIYRRIALLICTSIFLLSTTFSLCMMTSVSGQEDQYSLTINIVGSGSVSKNPDEATYTYGTVVTLTAAADAGWTFSSWSGDLTGST